MSPGGLEVEQVKSTSNAETVGLFHGAKLLITETVGLQPSGSHSSGSESTRSAVDGTAPVAAAGYEGWHKVWSIWGSIQMRENKCQGEDKYLGENVIDRSVERLRWVANGGGNGVVNMAGAGVVHNLTRREELVQQPNRSVPYSPTNLDKGLLRFYLTPIRSGTSKSGNSRLKNSDSISTIVL